VLEDEQTAVFVMVGAKDVKLPAAARVRRVALTFARLMGEAIVAYGANQELNLGWTVLLVSAFRGGENGLCVAHNALVEDSRVRGGETLGAMGSPGPVMNNNMVSHRLTGPFLEPQMVRRSSLSISVRGPAIFCVLQRLFLKCQSLLQKGGFAVVTLCLYMALFAWLISHQPAVLFSHNKPATSNQPAVLFSQNKSAPAINHQPTEQANLLV
jgi:hypothetical protein